MKMGKGVSLKTITRICVFGQAMLVISLLQTGCSGSASSSATQFSGGNTKAITSKQIAQDVLQLQSPEYKDTYEQARAAQLSDMFTNSLSLAPSEAVELGGHTFDNMHDFLSAHMADLQEISDNYGTIGNYADAMGLTDLSDVTPEQIQAAYDKAYQLFNQGAAASTAASTVAMSTISSSNSVTSNTGSSDGTATMSLTGKPLASHARGAVQTTHCVLGAIGAAAASVGAGFACVFSFGLACGAAVVGAVAAGADAGVTCGQAATGQGG